MGRSMAGLEVPLSLRVARRPSQPLPRWAEAQLPPRPKNMMELLLLEEPEVEVEAGEGVAVLVAPVVCRRPVQPKKFQSPLSEKCGGRTIPKVGGPTS